MDNKFIREWGAIESEDTQPRWLGKVVERSFDEFRGEVLGQNDREIKSIVESLYQGDVFILRNAFSADYMESLKRTMHDYGKKYESSFHKMVDGCPNFHRQITPELANNYALRQIKHSYYFFPWNEDPLNLFESIYKRWGIFKMVSGFSFDEYEKNIPSTGVVDRLQIVNYVSGVGELEVHSDPYLYQKIAICGIMSQRGEDFDTGGAYAVDENKNRVDLEDMFNVGDIYIVYPTVLHGVETIDKGCKIDWDSPRGRWFMGLYSNASDEYARRHTVYGVEDMLSKGDSKFASPTT